jgi:hypothetical protein
MARAFHVSGQKVTALRIGKFSSFVKPLNSTLKIMKKLQPVSAIPMESIVALPKWPRPERASLPAADSGVLGYPVAGVPRTSQVARSDIQAVPPDFPKFLTVLGKGTAEVKAM